MAAITNPEAIRFVNEEVRVLCEQFRALKVRTLAIQTQWYGGKNALFAQSGDTVEDGREVEGVTRLTAGDVTNAVAQMLALVSLNDEIIQKPCVRSIQVG